VQRQLKAKELSRSAAPGDSKTCDRFRPRLSDFEHRDEPQPREAHIKRRMASNPSETKAPVVLLDLRAG
jgi:hypothetical protein